MFLFFLYLYFNFKFFYSGIGQWSMACRHIIIIIITIMHVDTTYMISISVPVTGKYCSVVLRYPVLLLLYVVVLTV